VINPYVYEKLRQLEAEIQARPPALPRPRRPAVFGPAVRFAGRTLRRLGEGLEAWAGTGAPDPDQLGLATERHAGWHT